MGITVKLQGKTLDIVYVYNGISSIVTFYQSLRQNIDNSFYNIFEHAKRMATAVNVEPSKPRSCSRQRNRPNVVGYTVEEWYKINVAIPFIDHIISDLESRFSSWENCVFATSSCAFINCKKKLLLTLRFN